MRLLALALALLSGCGYGFVSRRAALPTGGKRVFAPTFSNATSEAGVEGLFTEAFREELANADALGGADASVRAEGRVAGMSGGPGLCVSDAYYAPGTSPICVSASSYHVEVTTCVNLLEAGKGLASTCVSGSEDYPTASDPLGVEANRRLAIRRLAKRLMHEAIGRLSTDF